MKKSGFWLLSILIAAASVVIYRQQCTLARLRDRPALELKGSESSRAPEAIEKLTNNEVNQGPEDIELLELRQAEQKLRAQLETKRVSSQPKNITNQPPAPTVLTLNRVLPVEELVFSGNGTPHAALQSTMAFERSGNVEQALSLMLLPPELLEKTQAKLASPDGRREITDELVAEMDGVTDVELLEEKRIADDRVGMKLRLIKASGSTTTTMRFVLTSRGWLQLIEP